MSVWLTNLTVYKTQIVFVLEYTHIPSVLQVFMLTIEFTILWQAVLSFLLETLYNSNASNVWIIHIYNEGKNQSFLYVFTVEPIINKNNYPTYLV